VSRSPAADWSSASTGRTGPGRSGARWRCRSRTSPGSRSIPGGRGSSGAACPSASRHQLPGLLQAGNVREQGQWAFWDVRDPERAIIIHPANERYAVWSSRWTIPPPPRPRSGWRCRNAAAPAVAGDDRAGRAALPRGRQRSAAWMSPLCRVGRALPREWRAFAALMPVPCRVGRALPCELLLEDPRGKAPPARQGISTRAARSGTDLSPRAGRARSSAGARRRRA
jgi:hypothetical protein